MIAGKLVSDTVLAQAGEDIPEAAQHNDRFCWDDTRSVLSLSLAPSACRSPALAIFSRTTQQSQQLRTLRPIGVLVVLFHHHFAQGPGNILEDAG